MQFIITILAFIASMIAASPVQLQPRAAAGTYEYVAMKTVSVLTPTMAAGTVCSGTVSSQDDCPSDCAVAPVAGMLGIATTKYSCATPAPTTSWTSYTATSTCGSGSAVTTYSSVWGATAAIVGCHAMN